MDAKTSLATSQGINGDGSTVPEHGQSIVGSFPAIFRQG